MSLISVLGNYLLNVLSALLHASLVTAAIAEYTFQAISSRTGFAGAVVIISALCAAISFAVVRLCFPRIAIYRPHPYANTKYPSIKDRHGHRVSEHVWVSGDMLLLDHGQGPAYCNACETLVVQGITCLVCRMVGHEEHHSLLDAQVCTSIKHTPNRGRCLVPTNLPVPYINPPEAASMHLYGYLMLRTFARPPEK